MSLHLVPVSLAQANEHVAAWHRHSRPVVGAKFCVGAAVVAHGGAGVTGWHALAGTALSLASLWVAWRIYRGSM